MWREDHLYDIVAVIGFNDDPVYAGKGSAIFLHLRQAGLCAHRGLCRAGARRFAGGAGAVAAGRQNQNQLERALPKIARADPHMGGAEAHRHFEIAAHAHAELVQAIVARQLGEKGEMRRGIVFHRRNAHQADHRQLQVAGIGDQRGGISAAARRPFAVPRRY